MTVQSLVNLEQLPAEVGFLILTSLPDVKTLLNSIAACPYLLQVYCQARDQIFTAVVRNEIGEHLIRHAIFLEGPWNPPHTLEEFANIDPAMGAPTARLLRQQELLSRSIIQACVTDELGAKVELTATEWLRLRRGMYNFRVAAKLSEDEFDFRDIRPFCHQCEAHEVLEVLYILYCLRNRVGKHIQSLEDTLLQTQRNGDFQAGFMDEHAIFGKVGEDDLLNWNWIMPFTSDIEYLHHMCQITTTWDPEWVWPSTINDDDEVWGPIDVLNSVVPKDHDFVNSEGDGFRWWKRYRLNGDSYDYHHAIPLGFMVWDDKRLESMRWMSEIPPLEPVPEQWRMRYQNYQTVEEKAKEAWMSEWSERHHARF